MKTFYLFIVLSAAVLSVPHYTVSPQAELQTFEANHRILVSATSMYVAINGSLPSSLEELEELEETGYIKLNEFINNPPGAQYTMTIEENGDLTLNSFWVDMRKGGEEHNLEYTLEAMLEDSEAAAY